MAYPIKTSLKGGAGIGPTETQTHPGTGLRTASLNVMVRGLHNEVSGLPAAAIGGAGGADVTEWTTVEWDNYTGRMSVAMTPMVQVLMAPGNQVRVLLRGTDQFGTPISEMSPWITGAATGINNICMSKVFAWISSVQYMSRDIDVAVGLMTVGTTNTWDPTALLAAATPETVVAPENLGIGLPLRIGLPQAALAQLGDERPRVGGVMVWNETQALQVAGNAVVFVRPFQPGIAPGFTIGRSLPGWEGCEDKLGFESHDAWVTKLLDADSAEVRMGGEPAPATPHNDKLKIACFVRSIHGSGRTGHPASVRAGGPASSSYPFG